MAWILAILAIAGVLAGTLMRGIVRKLAWTAVTLLALWATYQAWRG